MAKLVNLEDLVPVESAVTVPSSSVAKLPGELVALITLVSSSAVRVVKLVAAALVVLLLVVLPLVVLVPLVVLAHVASDVASEVMASPVSSKLPLMLLPDPVAKVLVSDNQEVASLVAKKPGELAV